MVGTEGFAIEEGKPINYSAYARSLVHDALILGSKPLVTTDPNLIEHEARETMEKIGYEFIRGGVGECASIEANRRAFRRWHLIPRILKPTIPRDLSVKLFGEKYECPVLMAPIGNMGVIHSDKEIGLAQACAALRVPFILSSNSSTGIEDVAKAVPALPKWFQLYWGRDHDIVISVLSRAKKHGFKVLVVTLDTWTMALRANALDNGVAARLVEEGSAIGRTDPVFKRKLADMMGDVSREDLKREAHIYWVSQVFPGFCRSWEDLKFLKKHWDGPIVIKGIMTTEDALLAAEHGMDGIVVSNHGGRHVDSTCGALDVLPEIVEAVGERLTVLVDSGFRTGADIIKGLALGAKAVLLGRPVVYGLGLHGRRGAEAVLAAMLADFDTTMGYLGTKTLADLKPSVLREAGKWHYC